LLSVETTVITMYRIMIKFIMNIRFPLSTCVCIDQLHWCMCFNMIVIVLYFASIYHALRMMIYWLTVNDCIASSHSLAGELKLLKQFHHCMLVENMQSMACIRFTHLEWSEMTEVTKCRRDVDCHLSVLF
jgi:hypothetical protein